MRSGRDRRRDRLSAALASAAARSEAGQWAAAAELWEQVTERNPVHGDYWLRLAEARFALQDYPAAGQAYRRVADLGVRPPGSSGAAVTGESSYPSPADVAYRIACCYAGQGDVERAVEALGQAVGSGLRDLGRARADDLLESLRPDPRRARVAGDHRPGGPVPRR